MHNFPIIRENNFLVSAIPDVDNTIRSISSQTISPFNSAENMETAASKNANKDIRHCNNKEKVGATSILQKYKFTTEPSSNLLNEITEIITINKTQEELEAEAINAFKELPFYKPAADLSDTEVDVEFKKIPIPSLSELMSGEFISCDKGSMRMVFIKKDMSVGYKIEKYSYAEPTEFELLEQDLRLNSILRSEEFYNGVYKNHPKCFLANIEIDRDLRDEKKEVKPFESNVLVFKPIPNATELDKRDLIPLSLLKQLYKLGYYHTDVNLVNFVKVPYGKDLHVIPIDSKRIGLARSNSLRSQQAEELRNLPYTFGLKTNFKWFYGNQYFVDFRK